MEPISLNIFLTRTMHKFLVFLLLFRVETLWAADPADLADPIVISELEKILEGEDHLLRDLQLYVAALEHKVHTIRQSDPDFFQKFRKYLLYLRPLPGLCAMQTSAGSGHSLIWTPFWAIYSTGSH